MVYIRKPVVRSENIIDRRQDARHAGISAKGRDNRVGVGLSAVLAKQKREEELARLRRNQELMRKALKDAVRRSRF